VAASDRMAASGPLYGQNGVRAALPHSANQSEVPSNGVDDRWAPLNGNFRNEINPRIEL
jgi:hypothetical protein